MEGVLTLLSLMGILRQSKTSSAVKGGVPVVATCCRKTETRTERSPDLPGYMWLQGRAGLSVTAQNTDSNSLLSPQSYRL